MWYVCMSGWCTYQKSAYVMLMYRVWLSRCQSEHLKNVKHQKENMGFRVSLVKLFENGLFEKVIILMLAEWKLRVW